MSSLSLFSAVRAFSRDLRGAASVELAIGAVVLVSVSALCFDLYSRIKADMAGGRMAVTMADYISRDTAPDGHEMEALGRFLYTHDLGVPANVVFVISAIHNPPATTTPEVLWTDDTIRIGDAAATEALARDCPRQVAAGPPPAPALPDDFTMAEGETVIIAEVCVRLTREGSLTGRFVAGDIYRLHALPAREPGQAPSEPSYTRLGPKGPEGPETAFLEAVRSGGAGAALRPGPPCLPAAGA